jgi:hypothetical protein
MVSRTALKVQIQNPDIGKWDLNRAAADLLAHITLQHCFHVQSFNQSKMPPVSQSLTAQQRTFIHKQIVKG